MTWGFLALALFAAVILSAIADSLQKLAAAQPARGELVDQRRHWVGALEHRVEGEGVNIARAELEVRAHD